MTFRRNSHNPQDTSPVTEKTETLATKPSKSNEKSRVSSAMQYKPFPISVFSPQVRNYVESVSKSIGCDNAFAVLPLLAVLSHAVGTTRVIELKRTWREYGLVWLLLIARSGSSKSPALELMTRSLHQWQRRAQKEYQEQLTSYEQEWAIHQRGLKEWERSKGREAPPQAPIKPKMRQVVAEDLTIEALAPLLMDNPRGILGTYDEWAKFVGMQDRYSKGNSGSESADWLKIHGSRQLLVNRKGGDQKFLMVPSPFVSLIAVTQPQTFQRLTTKQSQESGSDQRWLKSCPPQNLKRWTETEVDEIVEQKFLCVLKQLETMQGMVNDKGELEPEIVRLSKEAKLIWINFFNAHAEEQSHLEDEVLSSTWSKLEAYCARFALILHCMRWASGDNVNEHDVDPDTMNRAIKVTKWFSYEAKRVQHLHKETPQESQQRKLIEWIERQGGRTTSTKLQRSRGRDFPDATCADKALQSLFEQGLGQWASIHPPQGGRPTREFVLTTSVDETPITQEVNMSIVDNYEESEADSISAFRQFEESGSVDFAVVNEMFGDRT